MVTSKTISSGILRSLGFITLIVLLVLFLFKIQTVILYIVISLILTLIGGRIKYFLIKRFKFNNLFATIATVFFYVIIILSLTLTFVPLILAQIENLSLLNTAKIEKSIILLYQQLSDFLEAHGLESDRVLQKSAIYENFNFKSIPNFLNIVVGTISDIGIAIVSILFITFFFLKDRNLIVSGIKSIIPDSQKTKILSSVKKIKALLSRYLIGIVLQLLVVFILYLIVLLIFGVKNAVTIAFLCAILNIIPYIGPLIGTALGGILTMIGLLGSDFRTEILPTTIYVLIGFSVVQAIDNNISAPIIFSNSTQSHPLEIFLVILVAGFLGGILGMIVAIPLYTTIKVICKEFFPKNKIIKLLTQNI